MKPALVVGLHLRWDGVWQRPQHLLSRLAEHARIIVVEEPFPAQSDEDDIFEIDGILRIRPLRRDAPPREVDARTIAVARELAGSCVDAVWLYTPMMLALADALDPAALVYDCMDDLASFAQAPAELVARERQLLDRADLVFCGGRTIYESRRDAGQKVRLYASGVDVARFHTARTIAPHPILAELSGPIFTYTGVIDERLDLGTISLLADTIADGNVIMVGPVVKIEPAALPRRANVHFTGIAPYASLPSFLAGTDVALMPFALNEATRSISPTKTLEYFAAGLPVVSRRAPPTISALRLRRDSSPVTA